MLPKQTHIIITYLAVCGKGNKYYLATYVTAKLTEALQHHLCTAGEIMLNMKCFTVSTQRGCVLESDTAEREHYALMLFIISIHV